MTRYCICNLFWHSKDALLYVGPAEIQIKSRGFHICIEFYDMLVNQCVNIMLNLQQEGIDVT